MKMLVDGYLLFSTIAMLGVTTPGTSYYRLSR